MGKDSEADVTSMEELSGTCKLLQDETLHTEIKFMEQMNRYIKAANTFKEIWFPNEAVGDDDQRAISRDGTEKAFLNFCLRLKGMKSLGAATIFEDIFVDPSKRELPFGYFDLLTTRDADSDVKGQHEQMMEAGSNLREAARAKWNEQLKNVCDFIVAGCNDPDWRSRAKDSTFLDKDFVAKMVQNKAYPKLSPYASMSKEQTGCGVFQIAQLRCAQHRCPRKLQLSAQRPSGQFRRLGESSSVAYLLLPLRSFPFEHCGARRRRCPWEYLNSTLPDARPPGHGENRDFHPDIWRHPGLRP